MVAMGWISERQAALQNMRSFRPPILAAVVAILGVVWNYVQNAVAGGAMIAGAPVWAWCLILALGILGYWLFEQIVAISGQRPNYDDWDQHPAFRLFEIAYLWEDMEPHPLPIRLRKALIRFDELSADIKAKKLRTRHPDIHSAVKAAYKASFDDPFEPDPNWRIERDDALEYCSLTGAKPPFLFPEKRVR